MLRNKRYKWCNIPFTNHVLHIILVIKMSVHQENVRRVTTRRLQEMKNRGEKISMLTAYDYTMAGIVDNAGVDVILVGDSASNVMCGNTTTLPITLDQMISFAKSVSRATQRALVVVDMPFGSYQGNSLEAVASAIRIMKETYCDCLKMEGGEEIIDSVKRIISAGIPIMGHLGLMPQSINKYGSYTGCCAIVLEKIPAELATKISKELSIPTIGIGAGGGTDGQVLVLHDMLGLNCGFSPRFLRRYANLNEIMNNAIRHYVSDVKSGDFPNEHEQY